MIKERFFYENDSGMDNIEVFSSDGALYIQVEEPWAGSTETGFGYTCHIQLPKDVARNLAKFILEVTNEVPS